MSDERPRDPSAVQIRPMQAGDISAVVAIVSESPETARWSRESVRSSLENRGTLALVAESNGQLAGFVIGGKVGEEGEILNLAVAPSRRRQGIGRMLVREMVGRWTEGNAAQIFLEVRASNLPAVRLYESLGFTMAGRRSSYYSEPREDALVLERKISRSEK